jgi:hypothetical protein
MPAASPDEVRPLDPGASSPFSRRWRVVFATPGAAVAKPRDALVPQSSFKLPGAGAPRIAGRELLHRDLLVLSAFGISQYFFDKGTWPPRCPWCIRPSDAYWARSPRLTPLAQSRTVTPSTFRGRRASPSGGRLPERKATTH